MILAFVESQIPPLSAIPGVKLGLANIVTVFLLYRLGWREAVAVSAIRILLSALLFGSFVSLMYSAFGAVLSLLVMIPSKRFLPFSPIGVSVLRAVAHNGGQILAALILLGNAAIVYYLVPLVISGTVAGVCIGILGGIVAERVKLKKR
jgi:heptaprenyl diphosphate synthase